VDILGPHRTRQPERSVVGLAHGVILGREGGHREHRAEDLLGDGPRVRRQIGQHGGADEIPAELGHRLAAARDGRALLARGPEVLQHLRESM
jgi:hypothetical protein